VPMVKQHKVKKNCWIPHVSFKKNEQPQCCGIGTFHVFYGSLW
jgi:hypothetical protein